MSKRIDLPEEVMELCKKYKVNKTNMQKFLKSCGALDSVEAYLPLIHAEYNVDHDASTQTNIEQTGPDSTIVEETPLKPTLSEDAVIATAHTTKFVGFHPISGKKIYR